MSRANAQRVINVFSGGLVTEANPLNFPENSLSQALNITLGLDGSCGSRETFSEQLWEVDTPAGADKPIHIKRFFWKQQDAMVVVHFKSQQVLTFSYHKGGEIYSGNFTTPTGKSLDLESFLNYFDIAFSQDVFYFQIQLIGNSANSEALVYSGVVGQTPGAITFSDHYDPIAVSGGVREPASGGYFSYPSGTKYCVYTSKKSWETKTLCKIYWNDTIVYEGDWAGQITVSGYTYYPIGSEQWNDAEGGPGGAIYYKAFAIYRTSGADFTKKSATSASPIFYRDFEGLPNPSGESETIEDTTENDVRQSLLSAFSAYNLYNAGWPLGAYKYQATKGASTASTGNLVLATKEATDVYPSLCDTFYENFSETATTPETIGIYSPFQLVESPPLTKRARRGSHILSMSAEAKGNVRIPEYLSYFVPFGVFKDDVIPLWQEFVDYTTEKSSKKAQITAINHINGRTWYGVTGRSFKIAYSQVLENSLTNSSLAVGAMVKCYQENDPNSEIANQILETDGGTISLKEAGTVLKISEIGGNILVFADNGIWSISSDNSGFSPTSFKVSKIHSSSITRQEAVCQAGSFIFALTNTGILRIGSNQYGLPEVVDISSVKVKSAVDSIFQMFKNSANASIVFDETDSRIFFTCVPTDSAMKIDYDLPLTQMYALVYSMRHDAFYEWVFSKELFYKTPGGTRYTTEEQTSLEKWFDLGLFHTREFGLLNLYQSYKVVQVEEEEEGIWILGATNDTVLKTKVTVPVDDYYARKDFGSRPQVPDMKVLFEIPYDLAGNPVVDKSIQNLHIFLDGSSKYFYNEVSEEENLLYRPAVQLSWKWDWDTSTKGSAIARGNIKYPEIDNYTKKNILSNSIRVPGSGRSFSLLFQNSTESPTDGPFKVLSIVTEFNMDTRP